MASLKLARSAQAVPKKYPFPLHFRAAADKKVAQLRSIEVARNPWIQFEVHFTSGLKVSLLQVFEQGFMIHDRVLRPASVVISTEPKEK